MIKDRSLGYKLPSIGRRSIFPTESLQFRGLGYSRFIEVWVQIEKIEMNFYAESSWSGKDSKANPLLRIF